MSKTSNSCTSVKRSQCELSEKSTPEINKNEGEAMPHCFKESFGKEIEEKKPLKKLKTNGKNQRKDKTEVVGKQHKGKNVIPNNGKDCKKVVMKNLTAEQTGSNYLKKKNGNCQEITDLIPQQKEQKPKISKKKNKLVDKSTQKSDCQNTKESIESEKGNDHESITNKNAEQKDSKTPKSSKKQETFEKHIPIKEIDILLRNQDSTNIEYIEGHLRINPKFYKHAYLPLADDQRDLLIVGLKDRNRAFEGDFVVAHVNPPERWKSIANGEMQKTGVVVCIREQIHPRKTIGHLKQQGTSTFLYPRDKRVPLVRIYPESLPQGFMSQPSIFEDTLFLVNITNWTKPQFAVGKIVKMIGAVGDIKAESHAILLEHDLDVTPYSLEIIKDLPSSDYVLTENDIKDREDWRDECIFTIDPETAVDLDDAVSCKLLENGNYEIGVHISDVTHYLEFLSPLDIQVAKRAITVYMTDNVYHMLPKQLCQLCSLLPGQDKLAFSVIWEMTPEARIISHRFAKTVIKSCCQMAYGHAQKFIENPDNNWLDDFLNMNGNFTANDLSVKVNILHKLATQMRNKRFAEGALRIDQPKLHVIIDRITGLPTSYMIEEQKDSNRLIEEFMLLANMTVATHLYTTIPETALLRNHREPSKFVLNGTKEILQKFGIHLEIESSGSLHSSMKRYEELESDSNTTETTVKYRMMVINNLCSKAMTRATYRCSSTVQTEEELKHYALNASLYTHFTSPIRRYPDCVVHRLLHATMKNEALHEEWSEKLCMKIAANCNVKKYSAKVAQEQSSELYFTYLIDIRGPIVTMGIVLDVKEQSIDVILCQVGIKLRIYLMDLENVAAVEYTTECSVPTISISWIEPTVVQVINIFTLLYLRIEKHPELFRLNAVILPPNQEIES
ncbi:DIS3-like exonuclease 2 [Calliopsis andreniformis]|uniref:DIS3-like exonuclease 2 n=1 Tax=Calliopsis andreniformis TaxID=337506 RepID=UPI003FCC8631